MSDRNTASGPETRVVYTCWPVGPEGHKLCGLLMIVIGGAMLAEVIVPYSSEAIWGLALVLVGLWVITRSRHVGDERS